MLQKRYEGFLKTPYLWKNNIVFNLKQFEIESSTSSINFPIDERLRLGKYIERFVSFELQQHADISIIDENIQVQEGKITMGELDCLLLKNNKPIHLEIIYKFYLYDDAVGKNEIDHFIGPNRKDSLIEKLKKLEEKQLPLLHSEACKPYLNALGLEANHIKQEVYFKAQLFLPYAYKNIRLKTLNEACVVGYYISKNNIAAFAECKFFIPLKKDWLVIPTTNVDWLKFNDFEAIAEDLYKRKFSTLFWVKFKNGEIKKMFLVWW